MRSRDGLLKAAATAYIAVADSIAGLTVPGSDTADADTAEAGGADRILTGSGAGKVTMIGATNTDFADTTTPFHLDRIDTLLAGTIDLTN